MTYMSVAFCPMVMSYLFMTPPLPQLSVLSFAWSTHQKMVYPNQLLTMSIKISFKIVNCRVDGPATSTYSWYPNYKDQAVYIVQLYGQLMGSPNDFYCHKGSTPQAHKACEECRLMKVIHTSSTNVKSKSKVPIVKANIQHCCITTIHNKQN